LTPLLSVEGLAVAHGRIEAVRDVTFAVAAGGIVALIGPNGAGKTTTLGGIAGLLRPRAGKVLVDGVDLTGAPGHRMVEAGVALVPEGRAILARMTVEENLLVALEGVRAPRGERRRRIEEQYARFAVLGDRRHGAAGQLSGGEQQMLAIARALVQRPRVLLLDEPSMGLAPLLVERIFEIVDAIHREGTTVLLVEQNAHLALQVADRGYVLERGRIALEGPAAELAADPRVQAAYLGGEVGG
jgi:branched-chain amino acid transport system ATP-binding protein